MRAGSALAVLICSLALSGCSGVVNLAPTGTNTTASRSGVAFHGRVHGGQNPISGAHVYFYAIGNTGYGGSSVSLLTSGTQDGSGNYYVTTGSDGSFTITGDYTCPVANAYPYTYLLAVGGDSGSGNNPASILMAPVGDCTQANFANTFVTINEVSTVAVVYAASGFVTDLTHFSAPSSTLARTGLSNIFQYEYGNLYNSSDGLPNSLAAYAYVPQSEIDTLANILTACVNSNGTVSGPTNPTPCYTLFSNALSGGTTMPADTATAALNIARNPGANVANLYGLQTPGAPFQPTLSVAPNDFTIALTFSPSYCGFCFYQNSYGTPPFPILIDSSGYVYSEGWIAPNGASAIWKFRPDGFPVEDFLNGGLNAPYDIAIDGDGNIWVSNSGANTISEFNSSGPVSSTGFSGGGLTNPEGLTIDASNNVWVVSPSTNTLSEFSSGGSPVFPTGITTGGLSSPTAVAIDAGGNVWVSNSGASGSLSLFNSIGVANGSSPFTGGGLDNPGTIAIDAANNTWVANRSSSVLSEFNTSGPVSSSGYSGVGSDGANSVAVDGAGNIWVSNQSSNSTGSLSKFDLSGNPIAGSTGLGTLGINPISIAIDGSGNLWVDDGVEVREFIGLAAPVVTPIVANLKAPYGQYAVNKP